MSGLLDGLEVIAAGDLEGAPVAPKYVHPHKPSQKALRRVVCPPGVGCWHDQCHETNE